MFTKGLKYQNLPKVRIVKIIKIFEQKEQAIETA